MRCILGLAMFFIAIGLLISFFIEGFCQFLVIVILLVGAYFTLCK